VRAALALCAACSNGPTDTGSVASLDIVSGNSQVAAPGQTLRLPVVLRVSTGAGGRLSGQTVTFTVTSGGGSVSAPSAVSDDHGLVSVTWTLGPLQGAQTLDAEVAAGTVSGSPIVTTLSAGTDRVSVTFPSGGGQISTVGTQLPQPIVVQLKLSTGVPVASYSFTLRSLTCHALDGSCNQPAADDQLANPTLTTGADGTATFTGWTLGRTVNIKCLGVFPQTSPPQDQFDVGLGAFVCATAEPGAPATLVKRSQDDNQQAPAGTKLLSMIVTVEDQFGNAIGCWWPTTACSDPSAPEVQVTFSPSAGSVVSTNQQTTFHGLAGTDWTIGLGPNTLTITVGTLSTSYSATGT
jgi:hypothetical protein